MYRLFYVSQSALPDEQADDIVMSIAGVSAARNGRDGISGALLFTGVSFAQILEGERTAVTGLMADIARDSGHRAIRIVEEGESNQRQFADWSMAYLGRATYARRLVADAERGSVNRQYSRAALNALSLFMRESVRNKLAANVHRE